jgi:uncharacterized protein DUF4340
VADPAPNPTPQAPAHVRPEGLIEDERSPWATSLILLIAVAGLGLWAYFGEGGAPPPPDTNVVELFPRETVYAFSPMTVIGIELERGEEKLAFSRVPTEEEKKGQPTKTEEGHTAPINWQLTQPVQDRGDDTQIFRFLNRIQYARRELKLEDDKTFGETSLTVRLDRKEGFDDMTLTFGTPTGGQVGVKVEMDQRPTRYFRVKQDLYTELSRPSWVWRRKVLFEVPLDEVKGVGAVVRTDTGQQILGVARGPRTWRVDSATGDLADRGKAEELVEAIRLLRAATIHSDEATPELLEKLGLKTPWATLTVERLAKGAQSAEPAQLLLGDQVPERKEERYALLESRPQVVFTVSTGVFETALRRDRSLLFSPRLFMVESGADAVTALGAEVSGSGPEPTLRWRVERKEEGWRFLGEGSSPLAYKSAVDELVKLFLERRIGERLATPDLAALGLSSPSHRLELFEGAFRHVVEIGLEQPDGSHAVRRLLQNPDPKAEPLGFVYTVRLGDLLEQLAGAELSLLSPQIYSASNWDAQKVELEASDGSLVERIAFAPQDPAHPDGPKRWVPERNAGSFDEESFKSWLKLFDRFNVQRYVVRREGAKLADFGLDAPRRLTIWVSGFQDGKRVQTPRVLLIGKNEGESVYVMTPGGPAIGLVDERFLRKLYRGFAKGEVLWEVSPFDTVALRFFKDGLLVLDLQKSSGRNWLWGIKERRRQPPDQVRTVLEDVLLDDVVGRTVLHRSEPVTPKRLAETGLEKPRWRVEVRTEPLGGEPPERHALLIGDSAGGEAVWAMREGGDALGVYVGLRALESFLEQAAPPAPFPPLPR